VFLEERIAQEAALALITPPLFSHRPPPDREKRESVDVGAQHAAPSTLP
jgi:hypothetical protein